MTRFPLRRRHVTSARAVRVMRVPLITAASGASNSKKGKMYTFSQVRHNRTENEYSTIINNTSSRYFTAISISLSLSVPQKPLSEFLHSLTVSKPLPESFLHRNPPTAVLDFAGSQFFQELHFYGKHFVYFSSTDSLF